MSNIQTYLEELRTALYGEEVRSAIINAINQCYQDATDGIKPSIEFQPIENGTTVIIKIGDQSNSFNVLNGARSSFLTQEYSTETIVCAAESTGHVNLQIDFPEGYDFVTIVSTYSEGDIVGVYTNTSSLTDGGLMQFWWNNWASSAKRVTFTANILFVKHIDDTAGDEAIRNMMYPVGSVYISTNSANPSTLFGGTWRAIGQGRTLVGVGSIEANSVATHGSVTAGEFSPAVNEKGGEVNHKLTVNELPSHGHNISAYATSNESANFGLTHTSIEGFNDRVIVTGGPMSTASTGGNESHNIIQPYLAVYIWERTA